MIVNSLIVFDATDPSFYGGALSPGFNKASDGGSRPWFFQPDDWVPAVESDWYGSIAASLMHRLECYSTGFASQEEARAAADWWMTVLVKREAAK